MTRAAAAGAAVDVVALAGIRATREGVVDGLDAVIGTPLAGERLGNDVFDGTGEAAIFPGDLPRDPAIALRGRTGDVATEDDYRFIRFRPPTVARTPDNARLPPPHIRLDRALQFLLGDKLS